MTQSRKTFRHESLQDAESIQDILEAITDGLAKGSLTLSDDDGKIVLRPKGLLNLKLTASEEDSQHRMNLRISWQDTDVPRKKGKLKVR